MRVHHTKNKGDLGLFQAQLDLAKKGYGILLPVTEHEAFDQVAYREGRFLRVQVKYRRAVNGVIGVPFKSSWADRNGVHSLHMDKNAVDVVCVYCPDTDCCYYIDPRRFGVAVQLRITPSPQRPVQRRPVGRGLHRDSGPLSSAGKSKSLLRTRSLVRLQQGPQRHSGRHMRSKRARISGFVAVGLASAQLGMTTAGPAGRSSSRSLDFERGPADAHGEARVGVVEERDHLGLGERAIEVGDGDVEHRVVHGEGAGDELDAGIAGVGLE